MFSFGKIKSSLLSVVFWAFFLLAYITNLIKICTLNSKNYSLKSLFCHNCNNSKNPRLFLSCFILITYGYLFCVKIKIYLDYNFSELILAKERYIIKLINIMF